MEHTVVGLVPTSFPGIGRIAIQCQEVQYWLDETNMWYETIFVVQASRLLLVLHRMSVPCGIDRKEGRYRKRNVLGLWSGTIILPFAKRELRINQIFTTKR
jgi:hypothetical protein